MYALPDAPVSHGRWLAHCCAAVIVTPQLYALADVAAISAAAKTAAAMPARMAARRHVALLMPPSLPLVAARQHRDRPRAEVQLADQVAAAQLTANGATREGRRVDRDHELLGEPGHQGLHLRRHDRAAAGGRLEPAGARRRAE